MIYTYIPRTREAEAGKLRLSGQSELYSKTISKKHKKNIRPSVKALDRMRVGVCQGRVESKPVADRRSETRDYVNTSKVLPSSELSSS